MFTAQSEIKYLATKELLSLLPNRLLCLKVFKAFYLISNHLLLLREAAAYLNYHFCFTKNIPNLVPFIGSPMLIDLRLSQKTVINKKKK